MMNQLGRNLIKLPQQMRFTIMVRLMRHYQGELNRTVRILDQLNHSLVPRLYGTLVLFHIPINVTSIDALWLMVNNVWLVMIITLFMVVQQTMGLMIGRIYSQLPSVLQGTNRCFTPLQWQLAGSGSVGTKLRLMAMYEVVKCRRALAIRIGGVVQIKKTTIVRVRVPRAS